MAHVKMDSSIDRCEFCAFCLLALSQVMRSIQKVFVGCRKRGDPFPRECPDLKINHLDAGFNSSFTLDSSIII